MFNFHFHIPNYVNNSNGIKILWEAAYFFSKYRKVSISSFHHGGIECSAPDKFKDLIAHSNLIGPNDIVIYPDSVHGNPLKAQNVCRFFMAREYILNGVASNYSDTDFLFAYSKAVSKVLPQYFLLDSDLKNIQRFSRGVKKEKGKISLYFGKCRVFKRSRLKVILNKFKSVNIITRSHPSSKEKLYKDIASSELLISFDPLTSLCMEANLLGTPSLILDDVFKENYVNFNITLPGFYYSQDIGKIEDIIKKNHDLKEIMGEVINKQFNDEVRETKKIIKDIEKHFKSDNFKSNKKIFNSFKGESNDFYVNKWKLSPLFVCTNLTSVWIYLILCRHMVIFIFLKLTLLPLIFLKNFKNYVPKFFISNIKFFMYKAFDHNQINIINYTIRYKKIKKRFIEAQAKNSLPVNFKQEIKTDIKDIINLSKFKKFIIERL